MLTQETLSLMGIGVEFFSLLGGLIAFWLTMSARISVLENQMQILSKEIDMIRADIKELLKRD